MPSEGTGTEEKEKKESRIASAMRKRGRKKRTQVLNKRNEPPERSAEERKIEREEVIRGW